MTSASPHHLSVTPEDFDRALALDRGGMPSGADDIGIFKSERNTLVWRQDLADDASAVVFKLYRHISIFKLLRSSLSRGRRVKREFAALSRLTAAGVSCSEPLGVFCGHTRDSGFCEALVTRCVENSVTLEDLREECSRLDLTHLYKLVRRAHVSGVYHGALAPRNVLVTRLASDPVFHLIDMERSILFPYDITGTRMARRELLSLSMYIVRYEGAERIPELLSAYGFPPSEHETFLRDLSRFRSSSMERDLSSLEFSMRAMLSSGPRLSVPGWSWTRSRDVQGRALDIYCPEGKEEWVGLAKRYWDDALDGVTEIKRHDWGGVTRSCVVPGFGTCFFKRFTIRSLRFLHKPRRARNTLRLQTYAAKRGFGVPETLCLMERRRLGIVLESLVVLAEVKDSHSLSSILNQGGGNIVRSRSEKRDLLRTLGQAVGRRHALGLFHGDHHLGNVFCKRCSGGFAISWIDNEEGAICRRIPMRFRLHDLAHMNRFKHQLSLTDRMVTWRAYVKTTNWSPQLQRRVLRRVIRKSQRFWRKKGWML
jgi:tRNA A-37 threonylcarbamoyl transferase component Bud32